MELDVQFKESNHDLSTGFGETYEITDGGYDQGYNAGYATGKRDGFSEGKEQGYEEGKNSVVNPLEYATDLTNMYSGVTFPDGYELTINTPYCTQLAGLITQSRGLKKLTLIGNVQGNVVSIKGAFRSANLEVIDLTNFIAKISDMQMGFYNNTRLVEIKGELDCSETSVFSNAFYECRALVKVNFKPQTIKISISFEHCPLLSEASLQSIVDGLATVATQQTLILHGDAIKRLTQAQRDIISAKNWKLGGEKDAL